MIKNAKKFSSLRLTTNAAKRAFFFGVVLAAFGQIFVSCAGSEAIRLAPSIDAVAGLNNKLTWIKGNVQSGGEYIIELDANDAVSCGLFSKGNLSYKNKSNITIILRGVGASRTIFPESAGSKMFDIGSGVTLVLDSNITLSGLLYSDGPLSSYNELVNVSSGGTLVMNEGAAITGNTNNTRSGDGVHVSAGGTFIMNGGMISGNKSIPGYRAVQAYVIGEAAGKAIGESLVGDATKNMPKGPRDGIQTNSPADNGTSAGFATIFKD